MLSFQLSTFSDNDLNMRASNSGKYKDLGRPIWAQLRIVNGWGTFSASFCRNRPNCRRKRAFGCVQVRLGSLRWDWVCLGAFTCVYVRLGAFGRVWVRLGAFGCVYHHLIE